MDYDQTEVHTLMPNFTRVDTWPEEFINFYFQIQNVSCSKTH